jgi:hypothetical protein
VSPFSLRHGLLLLPLLLLYLLPPNSYGQLVPAIEVISATATISYGILFTRYTQPTALSVPHVLLLQL